MSELRHPWTRGNRLLGYDPAQRRVWVGGQRLHHGATGLALALGGLAGLAAHRFRLRRALTWTVAGSAMAVHDWHDRELWFRPGP